MSKSKGKLKPAARAIGFGILTFVIFVLLINNIYRSLGQASGSPFFSVVNEPIYPISAIVLLAFVILRNLFYRHWYAYIFSAISISIVAFITYTLFNGGTLDITTGFYGYNVPVTIDFSSTLEIIVSAELLLGFSRLIKIFDRTIAPS